MTDPGDGAASGSEPADPGPLLAPVAACAASGSVDGLRAALSAALEGGCAPSTLREVVLLLAPFGGFPRTLDALGVLRDSLGSRGIPDAVREDVGSGRPGADGAHHIARGRELFARVYGDRADDVLARLVGLDPELPNWVLQDAYGRVMSRPGLSAAQRERVAVVFLCALQLPNQLSGHVRGALHCGARVEQVAASLDAAESHLPDAALRQARRVLARLAKDA